jgi:hypothetical protein
MLQYPMPRVSDVDNVAPDDPVSTPNKTKKVIPDPVPGSDTYVPKTTAEYHQKIDDILGKTKHSLSSFLVNPKVFNFEERDDDEKILLVLRPHWFTNVSWIIVTIILVLLPLFLPISIIMSGLPANYLFVAFIFWYVITFVFAFEKFLSWYFDVFIVTDRRVVDIDFENLIVKKFSEADIHMIQDVTSKVVGLIPTMLNYGNVLIQTAAEIPEITFENVPNPEKVIKVLQQLREADEQAALNGRIH